VKIKLYAGIVAAAAAMGGLGTAGAAAASPVTAASVPVAHCNVILVGGYSPCFPRPINPRPINPVNPGGPMRPLPAAAS
jgi:hypothetical protein